MYVHLLDFPDMTWAEFHHPLSSQGRSRNKSCCRTRTIGKLLYSASQLGRDCSLNNFLFLLFGSTPPSDHLPSLLAVLIPSCPLVSGHKLQQYLHHTDHNIHHCPQPRPSPRSKHLRVSIPGVVIVSLVDQVVAPWSSARTAGRASPARSTWRGISQAVSFRLPAFPKVALN